MKMQLSQIRIEMGLMPYESANSHHPDAQLMSYIPTKHSSNLKTLEDCYMALEIHIYYKQE